MTPIALLRCLGHFQVMTGAQWLELLCKHIPDRYEQLVRYGGWYSSRSRGRGRQGSRLRRRLI